MPDWFYRTLARPVLFALPTALGRGLALGVIGGLGRSAAGRWCIDVLGHMRPSRELACVVAGVRLSAPVGLGRLIDAGGGAAAGLARFGVGCIELGPVALTDRRGGGVERARVGAPALRLTLPETADALATWLARLTRLRGAPAVRLVRLAGSDRELAELTRALTNHAELLVVASAKVPPATVPVLRALRWDAEPAELAAGFAGAVLDVGSQHDDAWMVPVAMPAALPAAVRAWRSALGDAAALIVAGGVACPGDAVALIDAGASVVLVDAGLVFTGPGLTKRIGEALLTRCPPPPPGDDLPAPRRAWFWGATLGWAMTGGGMLALALALTRVLLPYDERYLGVTAAELARVQPRLLDFMAHDRVTLAGAMLATGLLYLGLASYGVRFGQHAAQTALAVSALTGFASFFSFIGFGYFDPFHAFVGAVLMQFTLLALACPLGPADEGDALPDWEDDAPWRRGLWAQLLLVVHSAGLIAAGVIISLIGMGAVFVAEDLAYLGLDRAQLVAISDHLIPVVAHDRASLGGMLLANGLAMLLAVLWSWRRGRAWLWWTLASAGLPAYVCAIGVHLHVGYTDLHHLLPAFLGAALWATGLALGRGYLCARAPAAASTQE